MIFAVVVDDDEQWNLNQAKKKVSNGEKIKANPYIN